MTLYVDSSALLKRYVAEHDSTRADELLRSDPDLVTARHTMVEVRRNLTRLLEGRDLADGRAAFAEDIRAFALVELDAATMDLSAQISELTGARTLDALQLAVALDLHRKAAIDRVVSADRDLLAVAAVEGLSVFDPENP